MQSVEVRFHVQPNFPIVILSPRTISKMAQIIGASCKKFPKDVNNDTERYGQIVLFVESCRAPIAQDDATPAHWMTSSWLSHGLSKASRCKPGMPVFSSTA